MSYQVIARKYRPQTFVDLTGQEHIIRTLSHSLESKRLHQAYLFSGVRGTGKTTTARILAKGLNCHTGITSQPCLQCASCLEIAAGNSLDVLEIDAASNTGVDNVRDVIINNIALAPARDRYKVFVIDEVHMLSTSAFNALLKTLEEPPSHVLFIMATTELHKVPDTILSRCQQFEFRQIPTDKIFHRLREIAKNEGIRISDPALREIARAGAGSLRDSQSAFDQVIAFSGTEITEEDVGAALGLVGAATLGRCAEAIAQQNTSELLNLVEEIFSRGYDLRNFTRELMAYLRHLLIINSGIVNPEMLNVADVEIDRLKELSRQFSEEDLVRFFHLLAETEKEIKDSPHPRFQLEIGLVKLAHAARLRTLDELIKRLEALESRLAGGVRSEGSGSGAGTMRPLPAPPGGTARSESSYRPAPSAAPPVKEAPPVRNPRANAAPAQTPVSTPAPAQVSTPAPRPEQMSGSTSGSTSSPMPDSMPEPMEIPDFDQTEPLDLDLDSDFSSSPLPPPSRTSATSPAGAPAQAAGSAAMPGRELGAIRAELQKLNKMLILTAMEDAQQIDYQDGVLSLTFRSDDMLVRRVRDGASLFREIGEKVLGRPLKVEVNISGQVEEKISEAELQRQQLRERAANNPAVRRILEQTRGEIVWVKERS